MVEVDAHEFEIVLGGFCGARVQAAGGEHILQAGALTVFIPSTLELVGSGGASEEETLRECAERLWAGELGGGIVVGRYVCVLVLGHDILL